MARKCILCGKCFGDAADLRKHEKVHTGEKPYECKQCGRCFSQAGNLKTHGRVHSGEKPFECMRCGKCFRDSGSLRTHERVILERSLMNANSVASVSVKQDI